MGGLPVAHPPPSPLVGRSPNPPRVGEQLGWDRGWTTFPDTCLTWVRCWIRGGSWEYRAQALANSPHQSLGEQACAWMTRPSRSSLESLTPAARH